MVGETASQRAGDSTWKAADYLAAASLFAFALATTLAGVLNDAYSFGSVLHDVTMHETVSWRSGWALRMAPVIEPSSFFDYHFSPLLYLPNALSYLVPFDRTSYYGLVYGAIYGWLLVIVFDAFLHLTNGRAVIAGLGTLLFYLSGLVTSWWWPHLEIASALCTAAFFIAWARRRRMAAFAFLFLNVMVREDCGMLLAFPLFLLAAHDRWGPRRAVESPEHWHSLRYAILSALLSVATVAVRMIFFNEYDTFSPQYYGHDPFAHLSLALLGGRLRFSVLHAQYTWLPGLILLIGALLLRDARVAIGWVAYFPYWAFNFFSILDLQANLAGYKSFPLILSVVWPAVLAFNSLPQERPRLAWLQLAVLLAASFSFENGGLRFAAPYGIDGLAGRWALHAETEHAELYRAFESRLENRESLGSIRASIGALALYPYNFPDSYYSWVGDMPQDELDHLDNLLWFEGDRDDETVHEWLKRGHFSYYYRVIGTKLMLATTKPPEALATFAAALQPSAPP